MRFISLILLLLLLSSCSKPKTVLICGDHICINKAEAEQYFEENLSLEVKIIDKKEKREVDLIELNLKENLPGERKISLSPKKNTIKNLKVLSNDEKKEIKKIISKKKKLEKVKKLDNKKEKVVIKENIIKNIKKENLRNKKKSNIVNKKVQEVIDVCTILEKCSIDEISKFLLEQGKNKNFPDITIRQ